MPETRDSAATFIDAAVWHGSLEEAEKILASHPEITAGSLHVAAILGDDATVRRIAAADPANATARGGPRGWDALTYLCFSKYLRLDPPRSDGFLRAATALLDAGTSARTGFHDESHLPHPAFESALYGAAGVAHHAGLTRLLLERGADPNDGEVAYHAPETDDLAALKVLVETGRLTPDSLATMLLRKADWHDLDGIRYLLDHGADPNRMTPWGFTALHQALRRDNALDSILAMLDRGADPALKDRDGRTAFSHAARRGRGDVLDLLARRGIPLLLEGVGALIAACARGDGPAARSLAESRPELLSGLLAEGGRLLGEFAGNGNTEGVRVLLDFGVEVGALYQEGDGYFGIAKDSTALHVAAWRARHPTLKLLLERGAAFDAPDGAGRTPLALAVRACVDSFWTHRRSPDSIRALLEAGAPAGGIALPTGYPEADALLKEHGAT